MSAAMAVQGLRERGHSVQALVGRFGAPEARVEGHVCRTLRRTVDSPDPLALATYDWADRRHLARLLDRFQPELISIWNLEGIFPGVLRTLQESGRPTVYHLHDLWLPFHEHWTDEWRRFWQSPAGSPWRALPKQIAAVVLRASGHLVHRPPETRRLGNAVFCSEFARRYHQQNGIEALNSRVIYSGVEVGRQRPVSPPEGSSAALRLLYVGRFVPEKGADVVVAALRSLAEQGRTDVTLTLLGVVPPDRSYFEALARDAGDPLLGNRVRFLKPEANERMDAVYAQHDALVFASVREGLPRTVMEAMACGLAIVSTAAGGTAEIVRHEDNALVFPVGDHRTLADLLLRLLDQRGLVEKLGRAARDDARARFDVKRTVQEIEAFYVSVVATASTT